MNRQRRRRRMYAAGLLRAVGCLGLGAALGLRGASLVLPLVLSLLIGLALRVWSGGCCVAAEGVWCRHGLWGLDLVPWSEVALFERRGRGAWLETPFGPYEPTIEPPSWWLAWAVTPAHAYALWQQGRNESSDNATAVSPEQIAAWLAIPLDGVVEGSAWNWNTLGALAVMTVASAWGLGGLVATHAYALMGVVAAGYAVLVAAAMWAPRAWFRADAHGLALRDADGRRGRVVWRDVALASPQADGHLVHTSKGSFFLRHGTSNLGRLLAAIRELVQARNAGAVLPREDGLASDAALSRVGSATASVERGLSRGA